MKLLACILILALNIQSEQVWNKTSELVVIVNAGNTTPVLKKSQVKLIYLRKISRRWAGIKKNIVPVDRKNTPETKKIFLDKILGMTEDDLERYYAEREYQNAEMPPVELTSDAEVIEFVKKNIGAIGYVNPNSLNAEDKTAVKVIYP